MTSARSTGWTLRIELASDNDLTYPTLLGKSPTKGNESILGVVEVEHGRLGPTTLDGVVFAFFGEGSRRVKEKPFGTSSSIYLDEKATTEQRNAIGSIIYNDPRFQAEKMNTLTTTTITIDRGKLAKSPLAPMTVKIGDRGSFTINPCKGGDGLNPVSVVNGWTMFLERDPVVLAVANADWKDFGRSLKVSGMAGEIHYARHRRFGRRARTSREVDASGFRSRADGSGARSGSVCRSSTSSMARSGTSSRTTWSSASRNRRSPGSRVGKSRGRPRKAADHGRLPRPSAAFRGSSPSSAAPYRVTERASSKIADPLGPSSPVGSGLTGRSMTNVAPCPGAEARASIVPPCFST